MRATMRLTTTKLAIAISSVAAIFAFSHFSHNETYHRYLTESATDRPFPAPVPVMHTFFHSLDISEDYVLDLWKTEWTKAGFLAKVLTMEDAKKHPDFEMVKNIMEPIHGELGRNALGFYQWLAMAASGGGWMSHHDTIPTHFPVNQGIHLPNYGKFTAYQDHIPSLMSGTAKEWDKIIKFLIEVKVTKSDKSAFEAVQHAYPDSMIIDEGLGYVQHGFAYHSPHYVNCKLMSNSRVIHMSHFSIKRAVEDGLYPTDKLIEEVTGNRFGFKTRSRAVKSFLTEWRKQCNGSRRLSKKWSRRHGRHL